MAARMPMIATTIINSIRVKPCWTFFMKENSFVGWVRHTTAVCAGLYATAVPSMVRSGPGGELSGGANDGKNPILLQWLGSHRFAPWNAQAPGGGTASAL